MPIDAVLQSRISGGIDAGQPVQRDRRRVGQDEPGPNHQPLALPERDPAVVTAEQPRTVGDQQSLAGQGVIDRLGDAGDDGAGQV